MYQSKSTEDLTMDEDSEIVIRDNYSDWSMGESDVDDETVANKVEIKAEPSNGLQLPQNPKWSLDSSEIQTIDIELKNFDIGEINQENSLSVLDFDSMESIGPDHLKSFVAKVGLKLKAKDIYILESNGFKNTDNELKDNHVKSSTASDTEIIRMDKTQNDLMNGEVKSTDVDGKNNQVEKTEINSINGERVIRPINKLAKHADIHSINNTEVKSKVVDTINNAPKKRLRAMYDLENTTEVDMVSNQAIDTKLDTMNNPAKKTKSSKKEEIEVDIVNEKDKNIDVDRINISVEKTKSSIKTKGAEQAKEINVGKTRLSEKILKRAINNVAKMVEVDILSKQDKEKVVDGINNAARKRKIGTNNLLKETVVDVVNDRAKESIEFKRIYNASKKSIPVVNNISSQPNHANNQAEEIESSKINNAVKKTPVGLFNKRVKEVVVYKLNNAEKITDNVINNMSRKIEVSIINKNQTKDTAVDAKSASKTRKSSVCNVANSTEIDVISNTSIKSETFEINNQSRLTEVIPINMIQPSDINIHLERVTFAQPNRNIAKQVQVGNSSNELLSHSKCPQYSDTLSHSTSGCFPSIDSKIAKNEKKIEDKYCWNCHKIREGILLKCNACPRIFHFKCLNGQRRNEPVFYCSECIATLQADNTASRLQINFEQLCLSLDNVLTKIRVPEYNLFWTPVDLNVFPQYKDYVMNPMDLSLIDSNVKKKLYGSAEAFKADIKWIVHNCIIFNSSSSKLTNLAKELLKTCTAELSEISTCVECYYRSMIDAPDWFLEACKKPHVLLWAKLKGFPPWPAKGMSYKDGLVDVRFFGVHDRSWVLLKDCHLYSAETQAPKIRKEDLDYSVSEAKRHIRKLEEKYGKFVFAPPKTQYDPLNEISQIKMMLPAYKPIGICHPTFILPSTPAPTTRKSVATTQKSAGGNKTIKQNVQKGKPSQRGRPKLSTNVNSVMMAINSKKKEPLEITAVKPIEEIVISDEENNMVEITTEPLKKEEIKYGAPESRLIEKSLPKPQEFELVSMIGACTVQKIPKRTIATVNTIPPPPPPPPPSPPPLPPPPSTRQPMPFKKLKISKPVNLTENVTISLIDGEDDEDVNYIPRSLDNRLEITEVTKDSIGIDGNVWGTMNTTKQPVTTQLLNISDANFVEKMKKIFNETTRTAIPNEDPNCDVAGIRSRLEKQDMLYLSKHKKRKSELNEESVHYDNELREMENLSNKKLKYETAASKVKCLTERTNSVNEAKFVQWCACCRQKASYNCCLTASYCGFDCQENHYGVHKSVCTNSRFGWSSNVEKYCQSGTSKVAGTDTNVRIHSITRTKANTNAAEEAYSGTNLDVETEEDVDVDEEVESVTNSGSETQTDESDAEETESDENDYETETDENDDEETEGETNMDEEVVADVNIDEKVQSRTNFDAETTADSKVDEEVTAPTRIYEESDANLNVGKEVATDLDVDEEIKVNVNIDEEVKADLNVGEEVGADVNGDEELETSVNVGEKVATDLNVDEEVKANVNIDEEVKADLNVGEELEANVNVVNVDEEVKSDVNVCEEVGADLNGDDGLEIYVNVGEKVATDLNVDEEVKANVNIDEEVEADLNVDEELEANLNVSEEVEVDLNIDEEVEADLNVDEEIKANVNIDEEVEADLNVDEEIKANVNIDEEVEANLNVGEELEGNLNIDEEVEADLNVDEELEADLNIDEEVEADLNIDEEIEADLNIDEELEGSVNIDEEVEADLNIDEEVEANVNVDEEVEANLNVYEEIKANVNIEEVTAAGSIDEDKDKEAEVNGKDSVSE